MDKFNKTQEQAHRSAEVTRARIAEANAKVKKIIEQVGRPAKVCCYLFMIVLILACGYFIYSFVLK